MKKILLAGLLLAPCLLAAQETRKLDSIVIVATRAAADSPIAHSRVGKIQLAQVAPSQNIPFTLTLTPGVVAVGENGTGSGYAYLRIRGTEGSRIQVNLNGIAINDAESQEVFWVNLPSLGSMLESVQVQRGVGTSVNGPGAFGATVNMQTLYVPSSPTALVQLGMGSYRTANLLVGAGTGIHKGWSLDLRYAHALTDGYIRNGNGRLNSLFARVAYQQSRSSVKLYYLYGDQHTGITWEGISREKLQTDRRYNPAGEYTDDQGRICYYDNETDNYTQHHVQLNYSQLLGESLQWSNTLHFTKGDGYYENYKEAGTNDYILQLCMDNAYGVVSSLLNYSVDRFTAQLGVNASAYLGQHFGIRDFETEYYRNQSHKYDYSAFLKGNYSVDLGTTSLKFFMDVQYRRVGVNMEGPDKDQVLLDYKRIHHFWNPKLGWTHQLNGGHSWYASFSVANREPSRSDIKESIKSAWQNELHPERLLDYEAGYRFSGREVLSVPFSASVNFYAMEYRNQLVPTGKKSDVGYEIKENVKSSYRRGVEAEASWQLTPSLLLSGNVCLSRNKIKDFTYYLDTYDHPTTWNPVAQKTEFYPLTDLIYSPQITSAAQVQWHPFHAPLWKAFGVAMTHRFVGRQFYDNTSNRERSLPSYGVVQLHLEHAFRTGRLGKCQLDLYIDNLLNTKYIASAWVYRAAFVETRQIETTEGFFPQAGRNFMIKASWSID